MEKDFLLFEETGKIREGESYARKQKRAEKCRNRTNRKETGKEWRSEPVELEMRSKAILGTFLKTEESAKQ